MNSEVRYGDANFFLSYINEIIDRLPVVSALLDESSKGTFDLITSTVSIVEVAFALTEQKKQLLSPEVEAQIDLLWEDRSVVELVEFHEQLGRDARGLMRTGLERGWSLKPKDAIHLATASAYGSTTLYTYDKSLWKYSEMLGITVCEPAIVAPRLLDFARVRIAA